MYMVHKIMKNYPSVFSAFIINLLKGQRPTIYGDGSKKRDFVYVDDVNRFHYMCIDNNKTIIIYSILDMVKIIHTEIYNTIAAY